MLINIMFFISLILLFIQIFPIKNNNKPKKYHGGHKYAILIPARNESKVIEELLKSITNQTYKIRPNDVYIIVESTNDPTVQIAKKYDMQIIYRKNLDLRRKGYALDEAIKEIKSKKNKYDFYFIMDADNVLDKDYMINMTKSIDAGYDIGIGYRNSKNGDDNVISASSSLMFSLINVLLNTDKLKNGGTMTISGTGFYIKGTFIDEWNGYPFQTLTEDYELTIYAILNSLTSTYNKDAIFYDEQPIEYKATVKQRIRWIKGFLEVRCKYIPLMLKKLDGKNMGSKIKEIIGINGILLLFITLVLNLIFHFSFIMLFSNLLFIYLLLFLLTLILIVKDNKLNLTLKTKVKVLFYNPIFLITYVPCFFKALLKRNVEWDIIEHNKVLSLKNK